MRKARIEPPRPVTAVRYSAKRKQFSTITRENKRRSCWLESHFHPHQRLTRCVHTTRKKLPRPCNQIGRSRRSRARRCAISKGFRTTSRFLTRRRLCRDILLLGVEPATMPAPAWLPFGQSQLSASEVSPLPSSRHMSCHLAKIPRSGPGRGGLPPTSLGAASKMAQPAATRCAPAGWTRI